MTSLFSLMWRGNPTKRKTWLEIFRSILYYTSYYTSYYYFIRISRIIKINLSFIFLNIFFFSKIVYHFRWSLGWSVFSNEIQVTLKLRQKTIFRNNLFRKMKALNQCSYLIAMNFNNYIQSFRLLQICYVVCFIYVSG